MCFRSNLFSMNFQTTQRKVSKVAWQAALYQYDAWIFPQISLLLRNPPIFAIHPQPFPERDAIAGNTGLLHSLIKRLLGDTDSGSPWQLLTKTGMVLVTSTTLYSWISALKPLHSNGRDCVTSKQQLPQVCEACFTKGKIKPHSYSAVWISCDFCFLGDSEKSIFL